MLFTINFVFRRVNVLCVCTLSHYSAGMSITRMAKYANAMKEMSWSTETKDWCYHCVMDNGKILSVLYTANALFSASTIVALCVHAWCFIQINNRKHPMMSTQPSLTPAIMDQGYFYDSHSGSQKFQRFWYLLLKQIKNGNR